MRVISTFLVPVWSTVVLLLTLSSSTAYAEASLRGFCEGFEQAPFAARYGCTLPPKGDSALQSRFERYTRATQRCLELLNFSLSQKRIRLNPAAISPCLEARRAYMSDPARTKARYDVMQRACDDAITGLLPEGTACEAPYECHDGLSCIQTSVKSPRTCAKPLPKNSPCDEPSHNGSELHALFIEARSVCSKDTHCAANNSAQPEMRCVTGSSAIPERRGHAAACTNTDDCRERHYCTKGHCKLAQKAGASCASDDECLGYCKTGRCETGCSDSSLTK